MFLSMYVPYAWPNHLADCSQICRAYSPKVRDLGEAKTIHKKKSINFIHTKSSPWNVH